MEATKLLKDAGFKVVAHIFTAYDDETLIDLTADLEMLVPEYVRINRTYRDIPAEMILE